jgi:polar amino acid transport system permease protein
MKMFMRALQTALVSFLGVAAASAEMFRRSQLVGKADFKNLEAYVLVAAFYWLLTAAFTMLQSRLEARLSTGYVRDAVQKALPVREHGGGAG